MIIVWKNTLYAGNPDALGMNGFGVFNWSAMASAVVVVAGPYCVIASEAFIAGPQAAEGYRAGVDGFASENFVPGIIASETFVPGVAAGEGC